MARRPCDEWFPFYPRDWLCSEAVSRCSLAEQGIYLRLLAIAWLDEDCSIPADAKEVARLLPGARVRQVERVLLLGWPLTKDGLRRQNLRELAEHHRALELQKSRRKGAEVLNTRCAERNAERTLSVPPLPLPIPLQEETTKNPLPPNGGVMDIFNHWKATMGRQDAKLTAERKRKIEARLREGYSVDDLKRAVDGCAKDKWHMGENEDGKRWDDLGLICRSGSKVEHFGQLATSNGSHCNFCGDTNNLRVVGVGKYQACPRCAKDVEQYGIEERKEKIA